MSNHIKIPVTLTFSDIYDLIHVYYFSEQRTRAVLRQAIEERHPKAFAFLEDTNKMLVKEMTRYGKLAIQKICKESDHKVLARAMMNSEELRKLVFPNVSRRTGLILKEDMESMRKVAESIDSFYKEAQVSILEMIRSLKEKGEIIPENEILK